MLAVASSLITVYEVLVVDLKLQPDTARQKLESVGNSLLHGFQCQITGKNGG